MTPRVIAMRERRLDATQLLLSTGAKIDPISGNGSKPVLSYLVDFGDNIKSSGDMTRIDASLSLKVI